MPQNAFRGGCRQYGSIWIAYLNEHWGCGSKELLVSPRGAGSLHEMHFVASGVRSVSDRCPIGGGVPPPLPGILFFTIFTILQNNIPGGGGGLRPRPAGRGPGKFRRGALEFAFHGGCRPPAENYIALWNQNPSARSNALSNHHRAAGSLHKMRNRCPALQESLAF